MSLRNVEAGLKSRLAGVQLNRNVLLAVATPPLALALSSCGPAQVESVIPPECQVQVTYSRPHPNEADLKRTQVVDGCKDEPLTFNPRLMIADIQSNEGEAYSTYNTNFRLILAIPATILAALGLSAAISGFRNSRIQKTER